MKDIKHRSQDSDLITGLKPDTEYRLGITSVSSGTESKLLLSEDKVKLRKLQSHSCVPRTGLDPIWVQCEIYLKEKSQMGIVFLNNYLQLKLRLENEFLMVTRRVNLGFRL